MPLNISVDRGQACVDPATLPAGTVIKVYGSVRLAYKRALSNLAVATANVLNLSSVSGLFTGMTATGTNVAGGATVASIDTANKRVTLSANVTGTVANGASITFAKTAVTTAQTASGTNLAVPTAGIVAGDTVAGTNIAGGTTVQAIVDASNLTLSQAVSGTVSSGATITFSVAKTTSAATTTSSTQSLGLQVIPTNPDGLLGNGYNNVVGALVYDEKKVSYAELARAVARGWALVPTANITPAAPTYV